MTNDPNSRTISDADATAIAKQVIRLAGENLYTEVGHSTVVWLKKIILGAGIALILWATSKGWKFPSI